MTHVKLMGEIGEKFGSEWDMNVSNFRDMFRLIECQTEGFGQYLIECADKGINFTIQNGEDLVEGTLDAMICSVKDTVIITPVAAGAGIKDALKVIVGAILLYYGAEFILQFDWAREAAATGEAAATAETVTTSASASQQLSTAGILATRGVQMLGTTLAMDGVTGYLTPQSPSEAGKSYLYDGPENNVLQGAPVPLLYGRLLIGGSVINFAFIESQVKIASGYTVVTDQDREGKDDDGTVGQVTGVQPY